MMNAATFRGWLLLLDAAEAPVQQLISKDPRSVHAFPLRGTWTSKMAKIMDPIRPLLFALGYLAIAFGTSGVPGRLLA